jgi:hypothetical protein
MTEPFDTTGISDSGVAIQATLAIHTVLLSALVVTHPDIPTLTERFDRMVSQLIEKIEDPRLSAVLTTLETQFRALIASVSPGID